MKIAIIGAGFAGLAGAYYLSEHFQVTLFDLKGIGGGASGISSGLLHPYPGEKGRRSWHAARGFGSNKGIAKNRRTRAGPACCKLRRDPQSWRMS